jgi:membrane protein DedA with SNARE-associated domain
MWLDLFVRYGYVMVVVGTLVEADPTLLAATFLAHRGYFDLRTIVVLAILSTIVANQAFFWTSRHYRHRLVSGKRRQLVERAASWVERLGIPVVIASRFLYGCRIAIPVACGTSGMPAWRFAAADATGAVLWAGVVGLAGQAIGHLLEMLIEDLRRHEVTVAFVILGAGTFALWWRARTVAARASA